MLQASAAAEGSTATNVAEKKKRAAVPSTRVIGKSEDGNVTHDVVVRGLSKRIAGANKGKENMVGGRASDKKGKATVQSTRTASKGKGRVLVDSPGKGSVESEDDDGPAVGATVVAESNGRRKRKRGGDESETDEDDRAVVKRPRLDEDEVADANTDVPSSQPVVPFTDSDNGRTWDAYRLPTRSSQATIIGYGPTYVHPDTGRVLVARGHAPPPSRLYSADYPLV